MAVWDLEYAFQLQQTTVKREMYDASILNISNVRKLPSFGKDVVEEDGAAAEGADSSVMSTSGVFFQRTIDEAK
ncbi:hypothetical protein J3R85_004710 [Psidium guajava]|nr:hypothetical protein J3R85_004710 [Psidium guajava]